MLGRPQIYRLMRRCLSADRVWVSTNDATLKKKNCTNDADTAAASVCDWATNECKARKRERCDSYAVSSSAAKAVQISDGAVPAVFRADTFRSNPM